MKENFDLNDILDCYCKMKRDMFYEPMNISFIDMAEYEKDLHQNLTRFTDKLNQYDYNYFSTDEFLGGVNIAPKKLSVKTNTDKKVFKSISYQFEKVEVESIKTRTLGDLSIEFHLLSAVWIEFVGKLIDSTFPEALKGGRTEHEFSFHNEQLWKIVNNNPRLSEHQFKYYPKEYQSWQSGAVDACMKIHEAEDRCYLFSFDLKEFYHNIDSSILLEDLHLELISPYLFNPIDNKQYRKLNELLLLSIKSWSKINGFSKGLPIGLGASKVLANLALQNFDRSILNQSELAYYGRYIDDVLIVFHTDTKIETTSDTWKFLSENINSNFLSHNEVDAEQYYILGFQVNHDKDNLYILEGESAKEVIETVKNNLEKNSSEWRHFIEPEKDSKELKDALLNLNEHEEDLNAITGVTESTIKRQLFGLKRRKYEQLIKNGMADEFQEEIAAYFDLCNSHLFTLQNFSDYWKQMIQVIGLTLTCEQYEKWFILKSSMKKLLDLISAYETNEESSLKKMVEFVKKKIFEEECKSLKPIVNLTLPNLDEESRNKVIGLISLMQNKNIELYLSDLHFFPLNEDLIKKDNFIKNLTSEYNSAFQNMESFEGDRINNFSNWL